MTANPYHVNVEAMRLWIKNLRDGKYPQAFGSLVTWHRAHMATGRYEMKPAYCALGILAVGVCGEATTVRVKSMFGPGVLENPAIPTVHDENGRITFDDAAAYLPAHVTDVLLTDDTPEGRVINHEGDILLRDGGLTVARANDEEEMTFAEIADELEARYLPGDWANTLKARREAGDY